MVLKLESMNDCTEALDRANTAEQELGSLILDLRNYINVVRNNAGFDNPEEIVQGIEDIIDGD